LYSSLRIFSDRRMDNNIEEKLRNLEEWNSERARVKPFIDIAVEHHNRARTEARWKNFEQAAHFYREAIKNYKDALAQKPKYYLQDLLERIDHVIEEHINNVFNLKISGDNLKNEKGMQGFVKFIDSLGAEERKYIDVYDSAQVYLRIADFYWFEEKNPKKALEFYNKVIGADCGRSFINRGAYLKAGRILFEQARFKEALVSFVSVLSFDRSDEEIISYIEDCLGRLGIAGHKNKFLKATPNEARKLIMEVL